MSKEEKNTILPNLRFPEFKNDGAWQEKTLVNIADKIQDGTHFSPQQFYQDGFLYITSKNVKNGYIELSNAQFISKEDHKEIYKRCDVKKGDVLLTKDGTIGQCCVNELTEQFSLLSSVAFIRVKPNFSNYFLYHLFLSPTGQKEIESQIAGQALTRITLTKINNFHFHFPSFHEQQKIADCLSSLDDLITAENGKLDALKAHKKGLMQQLFPAEGETVPKLRFAEFRDSGEWEYSKIENYIDLLSGIPLKSEELSDDSSGFKILRGINITEGYVRHSKDIDKYFLGDVEPIRKYLVRENDLVIAMDGSKVGKNVSLIDAVDENSILIQRVARIRANKKTNIKYIYQNIFSEKFQNYVDKVNTSSGIPHISSQQIKDFEIGFPSLEEQQKIAECLSSLDEFITEQAQKIEALTQHKKGLLQGLFPGAADT